MVRIRLRRVGGKGQISFRIVTADREHPRDGRFIEEVGFYNPRTNPSTIVLDEAKVYGWLKNGAQPSESVAKLFRTTGTLERYTRLKAGEAVETLVAEANAAAQTRHVNPRTSEASAARKPRPANKKKKEKKS